MRPALALLALVFALPAATAVAVPLPVAVHLDADPECVDCVGVEAGAAAFIPNCFDCPAVGVRVGAETDGKTTTVTARACYSSFYVLCLVDETVTA